MLHGVHAQTHNVTYVWRYLEQPEVDEAEADTHDSVVVKGNPVWHDWQGVEVGQSIVKVLVSTSTELQPHGTVIISGDGGVTSCLPKLCFFETYYR